MIVIVKKLTDYKIMQKAMEFTSDKSVKLTEENEKWMYDAEHSPIRTQIWSIEMYNIPTYVSVHFSRHKTHNPEHFVKSNRKSNEKVTRETPVNHMIIANSQALINMARVRLCGKADVKTQEVMREIVKEIKKEDSIFAEFLIPTCERLGRCPEKYSCGRK